MSELVWSVLNQISVLSLISVMAGSNNSTVVHACECVENEPTVQSDIRCNNCNKRISQGDDIFFMLDHKYCSQQCRKRKIDSLISLRNSTRAFHVTDKPCCLYSSNKSASLSREMQSRFGEESSKICFKVIPD